MCKREAIGTCASCNKAICNHHKTPLKRKLICHYCDKDIIRKGKIACGYTLSIILIITVITILVMIANAS